MNDRAIRRELIWRAIGVVTLGSAFVWAPLRSSWVVAGITGFLAVMTLGSLLLALYAWRRGMLG